MEEVKHALTHFHQCNLSEDGIVWNDGFDKAVCSCGWKSAASKDQKTLVALFEVHLKQQERQQAGPIDPDMLYQDLWGAIDVLPYCDSPKCCRMNCHIHKPPVWQAISKVLKKHGIQK